MTDIPGMIIWTGDYMGDTRHLSTLEHGAYLLILMAMWRNNGILAKDSKNLAMLAGMRLDRWYKIEGKLLSFMTLVDGSNGTQITQKRLMQELKIAHGRAQKRADAGRAGGLAKALKYNGSTHSNAIANEEQCSSITIPINKKSFLNGELRQESRWVPTKRIGSRLFKVGERAPAYDGQPPDRWKILKPGDCQ